MIPNPREKRDGVIRDHVLELLENLHRRIERLENASHISEGKEAEEFEKTLRRIQRELRAFSVFEHPSPSPPGSARDQGHSSELESSEKGVDLRTEGRRTSASSSGPLS